MPSPEVYGPEDREMSGKDKGNARKHPALLVAFTGRFPAKNSSICKNL